MRSTGASCPEVLKDEDAAEVQVVQVVQVVPAVRAGNEVRTSTTYLLLRGLPAGSPVAFPTRGGRRRSLSTATRSPSW